MKKLAVIITQGGYNNLLQACEFARLAAESGIQVSVLFRDEAAARMTKNRIGQVTLSEAYKGRESKVREMLEARHLHDLPALLRDIKEKGDAKFTICRTSLEYFEVNVEQLIPELDEVQPTETFWNEEVVPADKVMTF